MAPQLIYDEETGQYLTPDQVDPNDPNYTFEPVEAPSTLGQVGNFFSYVGNDLAKEGIGALYSGLDAFGVESPTLEEAYRSRFNKQQAQRRLLGLDDPDSLRDDLIDLGLGATKVGALTAGSALTTGPAAPFTTAGALGVLGGGNRYAESKLIDPDPNLTDRERAIAALTSGISTSATSLPFSMAASKAAPFLNRVLSAGKEGAIGSVLDQPLQELSDRILERKSPESFDDYVDYAGDVLGRAPYAAATGFAMGAGAGAAQGALSRYRGRPTQSIDPVSAEVGAASILDDMAAEGGPVEFALRDIQGPGEPPPPPSSTSLGLPAPEPRLGLPAPEGVAGVMPDGSIVGDRPFGLNNPQGFPLKGYTETGDPFFDSYASPRNFDFTPSEFDAPRQVQPPAPQPDPVIPARKVNEAVVLKGEFPEPNKALDDFVAQEKAIADSLPKPKKKSEAPSPAPDLASPPIEQSAPTTAPKSGITGNLGKQLDATPIEEIPLESIQLFDDIPQFKRDANEKGVVRELKGEYNRFPANPIILYQRLDGRLGVVTGRHRLDLARRIGEKTIPAQILREADGITVEDAVRIDAETNIRDDKGQVQDFAQYFRNNPKLTAEEAVARGLLSEQKGMDGFTIARNASPDLFTALQNNKITADQAAAIAYVAGADATLQQVGLRILLKDNNLNPRTLGDTIEAFKVNDLEIPDITPSGPEQEVLFGAGTPNALKMEKVIAQSNEADRLRRQTADLRVTLQRIAKNPEVADKASLPKAIKIDVSDPVAVNKKIQELRQREMDLMPRRWIHAPEVKAEIVANVEKQVKAGKVTKTKKSRLSSQRGAIEPDVGQAVSDAARFAGGKAKDFWNLLKSARQEIAIDQPLPDSERFLSGKDNVLGSVAGAYRKAMVFPRTLANKFPQAKAALDAGWKLIDNRNTVATESRAILDPLYRLSEQDRAPINKVLIENRLASAKYMEQYKQRMPELTDQMLSKRGLSADQIEAYRRVRDYTEYALDIVKDAMTRQLDLLNISPEQKGIAEINIDQYVNQLRDTHYVPLDRPPGNFAVRVEGPDGGTEWYSVHKTKREAFAQKQDLIKGGQKNAIIEEIGNTRLEDNNSLPIDLEIMMRDVFPKDAKAGKDAPPAGFRAHLLKARMIPGFDTNMTVNLSRYALSLANYYARVTSNVAFKKEMTKIPSSERALTNYLNTWYDDLRAGTNPIAAKITRAATIYQLAGVPVSGLINTTQTLTTTHATLTSKNLYGLKGAPAALSRAIGDSWDYINAVRKGDLRGFAAKSPRHAELAAALQRGQSLGVLSAEAYGELANFQKGIFEPTSVADTLMKTFTIPEKANRVIAFSAGFNAARQKLGLPFNEAVTYAKEFVNKTQFEQSDANRPKLARGAVGRIAFQFKLFTGNYLRFLRDATAAKDYNVVATSLGAMFGLAGSLGLPGVGDAVDLLDALFGTDSRQSVRKLIGSSAGDALLYGLPNLVGVNISPAAGLGDVVPNLDQGGWAAALQLVGGPAGAIPMKWAKGYQAYEKDAPWNAAANALPRMFRGPIKALELATTGNLQTVDGDNILPEGYDTPATIGSVAAGLTPKAYSDFYAKGQAKFKLSEKARDNDDINMRLAKALKQGNDKKAQAIIAESLTSIRDNPDNPIAWKQINQQVVEMYLLPKQLRDLARAPKEIRGQILDIENSYPEK